MQYRVRDWQSCSKCRSAIVALNDYGFCALCWSNLPESNRNAILGTPISVKTNEVKKANTSTEEVRTITNIHYIPNPSSLRIVILTTTVTLLLAAIGFVIWQFLK